VPASESRSPTARADQDPRTRSALLAPGDPPPFDLYRPEAASRVLIVCDHASRAFPAALGRLGLSEAASLRHIAWDIGAAALARALSDRLGAPAVLAGYSRLVIDCNRRLEDPSCFVTLADGDPVPGNVGLTPEEIRARAEAFHEPYHKAIGTRLHDISRRGQVPALVAVHSFTPSMRGRPRPWHVGILWDKDGRVALPLIERLRAEPGLLVGDNEPYSGRHPADYTVDRHAESAGLPHVCLEVRQDELTDAAGVARWSDILGRTLGALLADESLYRIRDARGPRATGG
jgi:predicted N-formylglutamate amidohydrolase